MADINPAKTWGNEDLTPTDLNAEFSNVYSNHVSKSTAQTVSGIKTHSAAIILQDSVNLTFGTGSDATIDYDGTNLVIDPAVVGSGIVHVSGGAMKVEIDDNAAASVKDALTVEWDPADDGNMTDTSSGLAIAFTLPDDGDSQDVMGRLQLVVNDDAAGSEDTEWQLVRMVAGSLTAQSFGASLANDANNRVTTADGSGGLNGEANLTFDGSALQVTGTVTVGVDDTGHDVTFYGATSGASFLWDESADQLVLTAATYRQTAGNMYIGDSANAKMTQGVTINQGAADDEILAFKSSDVAHGISGAYLGAETDTFASFGKAINANGGLSIESMAESANSESLYIWAYAGQPSTTPSTAASGAINFFGRQHSSGTIGNYTANGIVFTVNAYVGGAGRDIFHIDEDGDVHVDGSSTLGTFDHEPDALLMRAGRHGLLEGGAPLWMDAEPAELRRMQDVLEEHEIIHWNRKEDGGDGVPFINLPRSIMLSWDGLYQAHQERQELREALDAERSHRMALETRLNLIEQKGRN